jgi:hypothetical protein
MPSLPDVKPDSWARQPELEKEKHFVDATTGSGPAGG